MRFRRRRSTVHKRRRAAKAGRSDARTICVYRARKFHPVLSHAQMSLTKPVLQRFETSVYDAYNHPCDTRCADFETEPYGSGGGGGCSNPHRHHRRRRQRPSPQRCRSSLMHMSSRVEMRIMRVGKTCSSARFCAGHRWWLKSAAIVLDERYYQPEAVAAACLSVVAMMY